MGGFAGVGVPIFGLFVGGCAVLGFTTVVVEVSSELALVVGLSTERIEPVTTLTSAPPAGIPCPRTTAPDNEDITFSACAR